MMEEGKKMKRVRLSFGEMAESSNVTIPEHWQSAVNSFLTYKDDHLPPIIVICGPKNAGKSTFARVLSNTLLTRFKVIGYLDTDVGQPEYTPPGCLSFHVINKANHDLATPCLRCPDRCFFYGDISPKNDPRCYMNCVIDLYDHFRKEYYKDESVPHTESCLPLVVNTAGWVKGVGYHILVDMLRYMAPTHVIQIRVSEYDKNLPRGAFWLTDNDEEVVHVIDVEAATKDSSKTSVIVQKQSRLLRELRIVAYFNQCFSNNQKMSKYKELARALAVHPPYEVPISKIKAFHLHCQVPDSELFYSLNASIVGLASTSERSLGSNIPLCIGLGIVRGIDTTRGVYYVLTPVPDCILAKVDAFLHGLIEIPTSLLQVRGLVSPYMCTNFLTMKTFGNGAHAHSNLDYHLED